MICYYILFVFLADGDQTKKDLEYLKNANNDSEELTLRWKRTALARLEALRAVDLKKGEKKCIEKILMYMRGYPALLSPKGLELVSFKSHSPGTKVSLKLQCVKFWFVLFQLALDFQVLYKDGTGKLLENFNVISKKLGALAKKHKVKEDKIKHHGQYCHFRV